MRPHDHVVVAVAVHVPCARDRPGEVVAVRAVRRGQLGALRQGRVDGHRIDRPLVVHPQGEAKLGGRHPRGDRLAVGVPGREPTVPPAIAQAAHPARAQAVAVHRPPDGLVHLEMKHQQLVAGQTLLDLPALLQTPRNRLPEFGQAQPGKLHPPHAGAVRHHPRAFPARGTGAPQRLDPLGGLLEALAAPGRQPEG